MPSQNVTFFLLFSQSTKWQYHFFSWLRDRHPDTRKKKQGDIALSINVTDVSFSATTEIVWHQMLKVRVWVGVDGVQYWDVWTVVLSWGTLSLQLQSRCLGQSVSCKMPLQLWLNNCQLGESEGAVLSLYFLLQVCNTTLRMHDFYESLDIRS